MVQIRATPTRSGAKAHQKKLEILAAASRVFRRQGLHATGMRDIAAEAGMHVGNLYYYFRNKQDLLAFCQQQTLSGLLELAERTRGVGERADVMLLRLIEGHVVRLNEEMPGSLAHLEVEALEEPRRREILRRRDEYEAAVRAVIEEGIADGLFREVDASVIAKGILGSVNWTVKWFQPGGGKTSGQIGRELGALMVRGLLRTGHEFLEDASAPTRAARSDGGASPDAAAMND